MHYRCLKRKKRIRIVVALILLFVSFVETLRAEPSPKASTSASPFVIVTPIATTSSFDLKNLMGTDKVDKNEPTFIDSNTLTLKSDERFFQYSGNVVVKHGDMTLTSDFLDGKYNEQNQIEQMVARRNVKITKGDSLTARSDQATYDAKVRTVTLTENPELEQKGSTLAADVIKIFLDDNRSVAEGQVRVKVLNVKDAQAGVKK